MVRNNVRLLKVLVSSPGDVSEERKILDEVIHRVNSTDGAEHAVQLDLFRWEDDVASHLGYSPQDVVDQQIPEFDIYLGILGRRFGTPTGKYGSGTEAEFELALQRFKQEEGSLWIMFFFKDSPVLLPTFEDYEQYGRVLKFRKKLESLGIIGTYSQLRGREDGFFERVEHQLRLVVKKLAPLSVLPPPLPPDDEKAPIDRRRKEDQRFGKEEEPTEVDERAQLVAQLQPQVFDVIGPCYLLDENFYFLDWNTAFDELVAKPLALTRDDHGLDFVRKLANCDEVIEHSNQVFGVGRENPMIDTEFLLFEHPKFGLIEFLKVAAQLSDDHGDPLGWAVNLNIVLAEKNAELRKHLAATLADKLNWTRYAFAYDKLLTPFEDYHHLVKLVVSKVENARVCIDLGAGTGNGTLQLLKENRRRIVWAVESNEGMLRYLRSKVQKQGRELADRLIQIKDDIQTLYSLRDKEGFFDAAILINVLYAVDDPIACLRQANRLLKPGGILAFSTPHQNTDVDVLFDRMKDVLMERGVFPELRKDFVAARDVHRRMDARIHRDTKEDLQRYLDETMFDVIDWHDREYVGAVYVIKAKKRCDCADRSSGS
jgi:ubiquinone/menaquinone biosynthesis C-methylase UbiE